LRGSPPARRHSTTHSPSWIVLRWPPFLSPFGLGSSRWQTRCPHSPVRNLQVKRQSHQDNFAYGLKGSKMVEWTYRRCGPIYRVVWQQWLVKSVKGG
jgi:hypothetical protein